MKVYHALSDFAQTVVKMIALVAVCASVSWFAIEHARLRMAAHALAQAKCRAELEAFTARNAFAERFLRPADPCLALEVAKR